MMLSMLFMLSFTDHIDEYGVVSCSFWGEVADSVVYDINNGITIDKAKSIVKLDNDSDKILMSIIDLAYKSYKLYQKNPILFGNSVYNMCISNKLIPNVES